MDRRGKGEHERVDIGRLDRRIRLDGPDAEAPGEFVTAPRRPDPRPRPGPRGPERPHMVLPPLSASDDGDPRCHEAPTRLGLCARQDVICPAKNDVARPLLRHIPAFVRQRPSEVNSADPASGILRRSCRIPASPLPPRPDGRRFSRTPAPRSNRPTTRHPPRISALTAPPRPIYIRPA